MTAGRWLLPRRQAPPASTNAARRSRELSIGEGTRSSTLATARVLPPVAATLTESALIWRTHRALGHHVNQRPELVPVEPAHIIRTAGVESLLGWNEGAGPRRHIELGETISPASDPPAQHHVPGEWPVP